MFIAGFFNVQSSKHQHDLFNSLINKYKYPANTQISGDLYQVFASVENILHGSVFKTQNSILIGKTFSRSDYKDFTQESMSNLASKETNELLNDYWGTYCYVRIEETNRTCQIILDPMGQFPVYYVKMPAGGYAFASEIEFLFNFLNKAPSTNLKFASKYLLESSVTSEETIFEDIFEIPHGTALHLNGGTHNIKLIWDPANAKSKIFSNQSLEEEIIHTIKSVFSSWLKPVESIALDFSGGLDSSGLLYILADLFKEKKEILPVNFFHPKVLSSDERSHARKVANDAGLSMIEFDLSERLQFSPHNKSLVKKQNAPSSSTIMLKAYQDLNEKLNTLSNNYIYVSGHGGDHIFLCPPTSYAICDLVLDKNSEYFVMNKLRELCAMLRKPIFSPLNSTIIGLLRHMFTRCYPRRPKFKDLRAPNWVTPDFARQQLTTKEHPFFYQKTTKLQPGKFDQHDIIFSGLSSIHIDERSPRLPTFYPLFSQPLIDLALSIPTYELFQEGYDRYPYRQAISTTYKTNLVWRKDKGETSGITQLGLLHNKDYIFQLCLEGKLAREGLIDKELLRKNLNAIIHGDKTNQWRIISLISLEIFFDSWHI